MRWKRLRPYVIELMTFLAIAVFIVFVCVEEGIIQIRFSVPAVLLMIVVCLWLIQYVFGFVLFSLRVIVDLFCKNDMSVEAVFLEQFIYRSSPFLDRNGKAKHKKWDVDVERIEATFFKIVVETPTGIQLFTSSEYFRLEPQKRYIFTYGKRSKALIDVRKGKEDKGTVDVLRQGS